MLVTAKKPAAALRCPVASTRSVSPAVTTVPPAAARNIRTLPASVPSPLPRSGVSGRPSDIRPTGACHAAPSGQTSADPVSEGKLERLFELTPRKGRGEGPAPRGLHDAVLDSFRHR